MIRVRISSDALEDLNDGFLFYEFNDSEALVVAVVDCRRDSDWIRAHLDR